MPRTLEQVDLALASIELQLIRVRDGLNTTLRQSTLAIESELTDMRNRLGDPLTADTPATGLFADVLSLKMLYDDLAARMTAAEARLP